MQEARESNLLTVAEVAQRLNVSKPTVYRRIWEGQIPALRIGEQIGPLRVPADELDEWISLRRMSTSGGGNFAGFEPAMGRGSFVDDPPERDGTSGRREAVEEPARLAGER
jgi:excisionase family DNA binding protein